MPNPCVHKDAAQLLIEAINATGGVLSFANGLYAPQGDPDWIDLGAAYLIACAEKGVDPDVTPDGDQAIGSTGIADVEVLHPNAATVVKAPSAAKKQPLCPQCGSENVVADSFARWDVETQEWELSNVSHKGGHECEDCGATNILFKWVACDESMSP